MPEEWKGYIDIIYVETVVDCLQRFFKIDYRNIVKF